MPKGIGYGDPVNEKTPKSAVSEKEHFPAADPVKSTGKGKGKTADNTAG